tara:strand:+ start:78 stop:644 length:567 start_codon:yes stop_codon:yes gene_type:complete
MGAKKSKPSSMGSSVSSSSSSTTTTTTKTTSASEHASNLYKPTTGPLPFATFDVKTNPSTLVDSIPGDRRIVLLGESTHGTEEYYQTRVAITKRLIEERNFTAVVFEGDWPFFQTVSNYTKGKTQNPSPYPPDEIFPPWMWRNKCMKGKKQHQEEHKKKSFYPINPNAILIFIHSPFSFPTSPPFRFL